MGTVAPFWESHAQRAMLCRRRLHRRIWLEGALDAERTRPPPPVPPARPFTGRLLSLDCVIVRPGLP